MKRFGFFLTVAAVFPVFGAPPASTVPSERTDSVFQHRREEMAARRDAGKIDLLFLGDSITQRWDESVWQEYYAKRQAANFGVDGDRTEHVLWRLQQGDMKGLSPRLIVLLIGVNNCRRDPSADIAAGVVAIVDELARQCPDSQILVLGIFPMGPVPNVYRDRVSLANKLVNEQLVPREVTFVDIGHEFLGPAGEISDEVMPDSLHLSRKGYAIYAEAIEPHISAILGPRRTDIRRETSAQ